jgi:hypothetical protein
MKIVQKLVLVIFTLIICQHSLTATSLSYFNNNFIDTIPQVNPTYKVNRIVVKSIKVIRKRGNTYKIKYKLINNGRNKIKLGKPHLIPDDLIFQFDQSLEENELVDAKSSIIESIKKQSISIRPGQLIMGNKIKFTAQLIPPTDRITADIEREVSNEKIIEEEIVKSKIPEIEQAEDKVIPTSKFDQDAQGIVEEIPSPKAALESPRTPKKSPQNSDGVEAKETLLEETNLAQETEPSKKLNIEETEPFLEFLPFESPKKSAVQNAKELGQQNSNEKLCPDLIIERVEILRKNQRFIVINYTIKNVGNIPISLHGESKSKMDNIAIQSHFTRSHNLTRGSIPINTSYIKTGNKDNKSMLAPQEFITLKLKLEIIKVTKFTPVLALTLNPSTASVECNKLNNIFFIDIAEKAPESINSKPKKSPKKNSIKEITMTEN